MVGAILLLVGFRPVEKQKLSIKISNFENKASTEIKVSVFSENGFLEESIQTKSVSVSGDQVWVEFDLPPGEYAVSTYQDVNRNNKLDRYFFGKPKEPYGFSNNVKSLGPPAYAKCKFDLSTSSKTISIKLIN